MTHRLSTLELLGQLVNSRVVVVDVRSPAAFNGWTLPGDVRGGHIPGALNVPLAWTGVVKDREIRALLVAKGITPDKTVIVYGSSHHPAGVMATRLQRLGYEEVLIYGDGPTTWTADARVPLEGLVHYQQLVHPTWLYGLLDGQHSGTCAGQRRVIFEVGWHQPIAYRRGHIPGAVYLPLSAHERRPWWNCVDDASLAERLLVNGVTHDTLVVVYGRNTTAAARAAVLLMYAGVEDVRLLDGGFLAWLRAGYPIETTVNWPLPVRDFGRSVPVHPEYLLDTAATRGVRTRPDTVLACIRSWAEHIGITSGYAYIPRPGRIAGALWGHAGSKPRRMDHYRNVDDTMRSADEIARNWRSWGITPGKRVVFYCGTGWRASEAFFYAYLMGWPRLAVYDGGWYEWSQDATNPTAQGVPCCCNSG